ncbi:hypothetical protein AB4Z54_20350 [Streptomyces sp. MCAF7]
MTRTDVTTQPTDAERFTHIFQAQRAAHIRDGAPSLAARRSFEYQNALPPVQRPGPGRGEHLRKEATDG